MGEHDWGKMSKKAPYGDDRNNDLEYRYSRVAYYILLFSC